MVGPPNEASNDDDAPKCVGKQEIKRMMSPLSLSLNDRVKERETANLIGKSCQPIRILGFGVPVLRILPVVV